tara:strand:- start:3055 stop:3534 length:480 start_codon:yes stop_codon:yes gene_type:complete
MANELITLILLTLAPFLELRASIPYGILIAQMNWFFVMVVAIVVNIILGAIVYVVIDKFIHLLEKIPIFDRFWSKTVEKTQTKIHPYVEKYGEWGLALFIGIPLPGSGVYSGAIAAYLLGMSYKKFFMAVVAGVLIAGTIVTFVVHGGHSAFGFFLKSV